MPVEIFHVAWTKLVPFDKALNQSASQQGGVYALFKLVGRTYRLFYVGMSKDFYKRFGTHRNNASHVMTAADIKKHYVSFGVARCFEKSQLTHDITPSLIHQLESFLINTYHPVGNDASTKKGYKGNPIIVFNQTDTILRGVFKKQMCNSPELIKLLKYFL
jgi:hypothetical protein